MIYYQRLNYAEIGMVWILTPLWRKHYPPEVTLSPEELVTTLSQLLAKPEGAHLIVLSRGCGHDGRYTLSFTETDHPLRGWPPGHKPYQPEWFTDAMEGRIPVAIPYGGD